MSSSPDTEPSVDRLSAQCIRFADQELRGYSPLYERLARAIADDTELLTCLARFPDVKRLPLNVFAATHYLIRQDPGSDLASIYRGAPGDPYPLFRALLVEREGEVVDILATRTIQTNEVGRSAVLFAAFAAVAAWFDDAELALVEIGPSAGLNLLFDRYHACFDDGRTSGLSESAVQLTCDLDGDSSPPLPTGDLRIVSREGIDLTPVDVDDDDGIAWLEACIWPDVPGRLERFEAAVTIARSEPPVLRRGDALDLLGPVVDAIDAQVVPVVFSTWALAYLDKPGRLRVHELLAERGAHRDIALVTAEFPPVTPWIPGPPRAPTRGGKVATLLSLTSWRSGDEQRQPLAWVHPHGQWLDWFETSNLDA